MKDLCVKTEDKAIKLINKYGAWVLRRMPNFWDNKKVVLCAVEKDGYLLEIVSNRLQNEKDVVIKAIMSFPRAILFAGDKLASDEKIRELAFKINGKPFIADKKAFKHFKFHDDILIKKTTKVVRNKKSIVRSDSYYFYDEELIFNEEQIKKSLIYRKLHKLYSGKASLEEILTIEEGLKNRMFSPAVRLKKEPKQKTIEL